MLWFWLFVGPALVLAAASLRGDRARAAYVADALAEQPGAKTPPASVIVPVSAEIPPSRAKTWGDNLEALRRLDYPDYELVLVAHSAGHIPKTALTGRLTVVLAGQPSPDGSPGQLLASGVRGARKNTQLLAFTTAEGTCPKGWLRALSAPLAREEVRASTGCPWYLPQPPDFWSLMRSVWNAPVAGLFGPGRVPFVWCGSMAVSKDAFVEARVAEFWSELGPGKGTRRATLDAGFSLAFAPGAMVAFHDRITAGQFFQWARSRITSARVAYPYLWRRAFLFYFLQCGAMAAALTASLHGSRGAEWVLVVQWGLTMLKGTNYATLAKAQFPEERPWFDRFSWVHALWVPLAMWVWLAVLISSIGPARKRL